MQLINTDLFLYKHFIPLIARQSRRRQQRLRWRQVCARGDTWLGSHTPVTHTEMPTAENRAVPCRINYSGSVCGPKQCLMG